MNGKQARRMRKMAGYNPHAEKNYKETNVRQDVKTGLRTSTMVCTDPEYRIYKTFTRG